MHTRLTVSTPAEAGTLQAAKQNDAELTLDAWVTGQQIRMGYVGNTGDPLTHNPLTDDLFNQISTRVQ